MSDGAPPALGGPADAPDEHHWLPYPELDLMKLAALLRKAMPAAPDDETRERIEAAWVALINAVKQPTSDAARLRRRLGRLRGELEHLLRRSESDAESGSAHDQGIISGQATRREDQ
jgi:hypothetical protein